MKSYLAVAFGAAALLGQGANAQFLYAGCDVSNAVLNLPSGQTALRVPSSLKPNSIALGVGVQNYTCSSAGNYSAAGAVAQFFDISCLLQANGGNSAFEQIQNVVFEFWNGTASADLSTLAQIDTLVTDAFLLNLHLGTHYFQPSPSGASISPVFDYRAASRQQDADAFVLAAANGSTPAPTGAQDIAWLQLAQVQGGLGKVVFRVDTVSGQPPASCKPGSGLISVKYAAKYWFFGGPPSPIVQEFDNIVADVWDKINAGYYKLNSSSTGSKDVSSKAGIKALVADDDDTPVVYSEPALSLDSKSRSFSATIALIVINSVLVVGLLLGVFFYVRRSNRAKKSQYLAAGAHTAPMGAFDDMEHEVGPYDPTSSLARLNKY